MSPKSKKLAVLAATLVLAACNPRNQDMASCTVEAMKVYPHLNADDHSKNEAADFEYECMISKGYVWENDTTKCPRGGGHFEETQVYCYRWPLPWE